MYFSHEAIINIFSTGKEREREQVLDFILNHSGWSQMAIGYMMKRGGNREDAEEIFLDSIYALDRNLRNGDFTGAGNLEAYFMGIVKVKWQKHAQKKSRRWRLFDFFSKSQPLKEEDQQDIVWYDQQDAIHLLENIIASMGKHCREIMRLHQLSYSLEETAMEMGLPNADRAKTERSRCIQRTRARIAEHPEWKNFFKQ